MNKAIYKQWWFWFIVFAVFVAFALKSPQSQTEQSVSDNASPNQTAIYDGTTELQCGVNVDCNNQGDVTEKMRIRWGSFSSSTPFSNVCLEAISRVEEINSAVWSGGMAPNQMAACNAK